MESKNDVIIGDLIKSWQSGNIMHDRRLQYGVQILLYGE